MMHKDQEEARRVCLLGHNAIITGSAGTGKTYLLRTIIKELKETGHQVGVVCPTGISATQYAQGATVHR